MHINPIKLRNGPGNGNPRDGFCLMQAVHWFSGADKLSDHPDCAAPVLCALGIQLNDTAPSQEHRDSLWPLVWQLLDSVDPGAEQRRVEHIVREVVHRIIADAFDKIGLTDHAMALRAADSMREIGAAGKVARGAAWTEAASVAATADAAAAAAAAWTEAASVAAKWDELRAIFIEAITLGKHGEIDPSYEPRAKQLYHILELAK